MLRLRLRRKLDEQQRRRRLNAYRAALAIAVASVVAPIAGTRYVPFTDAPEHAAVMATLRHWGDPAFSAAYRLDVVHSQYFLYHLVGAAITFVVGDAELANRILLVAVGIAFPLSFEALLRAMRRDPRLAIFACLPFFSRALVIGFLPFVASIPLVFYTLAVAVRQGRAPTKRRGLALAGLAIVVFYAHVSTYIVLVVCAAAWTMIGRRTHGETHWRMLERWARSLAWVVPSAVTAVLWASLGSVALEGESLRSSGEIGRMSVGRSLYALPLWMFDVWRSHGDEVAAALWWTAFALAAVLTVAVGSPPSRRALMRIYAPLACVLALYLLTPYRVGAAVMLNVRLAPILVLFAVLALRLPRRGRPSGVVIGLVTVSTVIGGGTALVESRRCRQEELGDLDATLAAIPKGSRIVTLHFGGPSRRTHLAPYLHVGAYHRVRGGGIASFSFTELSHWPLRYRDAARPPTKAALFWDTVPCAYRNTIDGAYYDFVLVRGDHNPFAHRPPGPTFRPIRRSGLLTLYTKDTTVSPRSAEPGENDSACPEWAP